MTTRQQAADDKLSGGGVGSASLATRSVRTVPPTVNEVVAELEGEIVTNVLPAGAKLLSERRLAEQRGLSRPAVREVLHRLQERGLVVAHPGRGSFVRELQPTRGEASAELLTRRGEVTARELARARRMLECETAELAATHRSQEDLDLMRTVLDRFDSSADLSRTADLDLAFHEAIACAARNVVLQVMFGSIRTLSRALILRSMIDRRLHDVSSPLHRAILTAIDKGDAVGARAAMYEHLSQAETYYGADLDAPLVNVLLQRADRMPEVADVLRTAGSVLSED